MRMSSSSEYGRAFAIHDVHECAPLGSCTGVHFDGDTTFVDVVALAIFGAGGRLRVNRQDIAAVKELHGLEQSFTGGGKV